MNNVLHKYQNGNCEVVLLEDGTKIRSFEGNFNLDYPESIDLKIINYCDAGCVYCHENSTKYDSKECDLELIKNVFDSMLSGTEVAIGGGNPLSSPYLEQILEYGKSKNLVCNVTVNERHYKPSLEYIKSLIQKDLIKGVGYSVVKELPEKIPNLVLHFIHGIHDYELIKKAAKEGYKILILGYKDFGRGSKYFDKFNQEVVRKQNMNYFKLFELAKIVKQNNAVLAFDSLAIDQLKPKRLFTNVKDYDSLYMGSEGSHSMYIDAVKGTYAMASYMSERYKFKNLKDAFGNVKVMGLK